jgi:LCCL domain
METTQGTKGIRKVVNAAFVGLLFAVVGAVGAQEGSKETAKEPAKESPKKAAGAVEIRFVDGSTMKLQLRETKIELDTDYGKLQIPVADIQRIEFGLRMPEETRKKVDAAIKDLASSDFRRRQAASTDLLALKENAYSALLVLAEGKDAEAARRAQEILDKLREAMPEENLEIPLHDIVHTAKSKIAGHIKVDSLKVTTRPFGDQLAKLSDMRVLQTQGGHVEEQAASANILPDPGRMNAYANEVGKTLSFRVTGPQPGVAAQQGVFGTTVYTVDSSLAASAVHAGAIRPGQTGVIRVTIVGAHPGFTASARNGVMSQPWGPWAGFRIEVPKGGGPPRKD